MRRHSFWTKAFLTSAWLLLLAGVGSAQKYGKIVGKVTDAETGEPLPGANILIVGTTIGAASDVNGNFVILRVPPGKYDVRAMFIGYQSMVKSGVEVMTDLTTRVDFALKVKTLDIGQEVVVVAQRPIIRKDLTASESRVQAEEIARMPVQEMADVLNLQAGVTRDAFGGIHIRGGRSTEVAYMINGVRITDDFTKTQAVQVENESIQELQVIAGTFNAEYGEAMSGIVNIVTKTGGNEFHGKLEAYTGDYISGNSDIFWNIDNINPVANYNFQGALSGPIKKDKLTFFVTGRRWVNDGWLYAPYVYSPQGRVQVIDGDTVAVRGDSSAVSMNRRERWSGQASLEWRITGPLKLKLDAFGSFEKRRNYDHFFRLNPYGKRGDEDGGYAFIGNLTHAVSARTYYEITAAYKFNQLRSVLYDDPFDPRYVHPDSLNTGANQFARAGTDLARFKRSTTSWIGKFDITSQVNDRHQLKGGIELKVDRVFMDDLVLVPDEDENGRQIEPFRPRIPPPTEVNHTLINRRPYTFAAYLQDKIEYESFIINIGIRFDLFDARGKVPRDLEDPNIYNPFKLQNIYRDLNRDGVISLDEQTEANKLTVEDRLKYWYRKTSIKTQWSPRLGVAYPITDRGVIHFSYGIFRQIPDYEQLYRGDELKLNQVSPNQGPFGNPDLNPQRTTMYELGLQQQLSEHIGADITLFYRDIRDWVTSSALYPTAIAGVSYSRKINRDFANVRGFTLALNRRFANHYSFSVDYTFQIAEGTNSTPEEEYFSQIGGAEPTRQLTPLAWDQRHTLNASFYFGGKDWGVSFIERFNSGQPYTPQLVTIGRVGRDIIAGLEKNSRRKPNQFTVDMTAFKEFQMQNFRLKLFLRIFNLFDAKNPVNVFGDTGQPDFTLNMLQAVSADPTWFVRPDFYSQPRRVQLGMTVSF